MIDFHSVTLEDKRWIVPLVWAEGSSSADFAFANIYMWDHAYSQYVARCGDRVVVMLGYNDAPFFAYPVGTGPLAPVMDELAAYAASHGFPFVVRGVTGGHLPDLEALYPGRCGVTPDRDVWDYVYSAEKLDTLAGKHLHGKRNHIHRFESENPDWRFSPLTPADFPACLNLLDGWIAEKGDSVDGGAEAEYEAIRRALAHFDDLDMDGGILRVGDRPVAFTLGERVCEHTFIVHFEKAIADINGAYPMINREFVRLVRQKYPAVEWINREDDMGLDSLRQSKESYRPDRMVEKYSVVIKNV